MKLIPAIDLKNNKFILASGGDRNYYKTLPADLSPTSDPIKFIDYLISIYDFNTIYLADLDSIRKYDANSKLIDEILCKYKNIKPLVLLISFQPFWVIVYVWYAFIFRRSSVIRSFTFL